MSWLGFCATTEMGILFEWFFGREFSGNRCQGEQEMAGEENRRECGFSLNPWPRPPRLGVRKRVSCSLCGSAADLLGVRVEEKTAHLVRHHPFSQGQLSSGNWAASLSLFTYMKWRRKWQPTPVFLPGESRGRGSLVGCRLWGRTVRHNWSNLAAAAATIWVIFTG